jgi:SAM-dependent methyltransferase
MWEDYDAEYRRSLEDAEFLSWRESGARKKAGNIARVCRELEIASVIEIGCGTGAVLRRLHAMNFAREYCCSDLSPSAVDFTVASCRGFRPRAVVGRADDLPFPDGSFSVAVLSHVLEHLRDPVAALHEASRIARFVVVEVPTERVLNNLVRTKLLLRPYASIALAGHVQFWSPSSIARFLTADAGLEILDRHRDLLDDEAADAAVGGDAASPPGAKALVKRVLKRALPASIYSRLLTTHAVFLCRRPATAREATGGASHPHPAARGTASGSL